MTVRNGNQRLSERRRNALWLIAGLLLSVALLFAANWEANRQEQMRMDAFRSRVADLAKISESIIIEQLRQFDDTLLVLRRVYAADPNRFIKSIGLLRNGSLADREILVMIAMENLVGNAFKFTGKEAHPRIEFGAVNKDGETCYFIRDNGAGFDMAYVDKLFGPFQRLHTTEEFAGTGIGLATVKRIIARHGGRVWAEGEIGKGATFYFTLPS